MIKESLQSFLRAVQALFRDKSSLAIFAGLYALLLATLYGFIAIREATLWQVLLTLLFIALAPVIFFLLQTAIIGQTQTGRIDWPAVLRKSTRLALVTIPVILIGLGFMWLLNRWQIRHPAPLFSPPVPPPGAQRPVAPLHWPTALFASARVFVFGIALPLLLIQLWLEAAGNSLLDFFRGGVRPFLSRIGRILQNAFVPGSVVIYGLGMLIFGVIPYVLLFVHIPAKGAWTDIVIFSIRLLVVFAFIFLGWLITLRAFVKCRQDTEESLPVKVGDQPSPGQPAVSDQPEMSAV